MPITQFFDFEQVAETVESKITAIDSGTDRLYPRVHKSFIIERVVGFRLFIFNETYISHNIIATRQITMASRNSFFGFCWPTPPLCTKHIDSARFGFENVGHYIFYKLLLSIYKFVVRTSGRSRVHKFGS